MNSSGSDPSRLDCDCADAFSGVVFFFSCLSVSKSAGSALQFQQHAGVSSRAATLRQKQTEADRVFALRDTRWKK